MKKVLITTVLFSFFISCTIPKTEELKLVVYQTSSAGDNLKLLNSNLELEQNNSSPLVVLNPGKKYQKITGFGGAFTESSAFLLNEISEENRKEILNAYFSTEGAQYSLTRTHMNSCDFSLEHYSYAPIENDKELINFSIEEDMYDVIPMIHEAQNISEEGFKILASPWTAPPWMKDNNNWNGGKLLKEYYPTWALFFSKYATAYAELGIDIWGFTVENEPLGNDENWESMHYTPQETADFVKNHLGPQLKKDSLDINILVYDQNRGEELKEWADILLNDQELLPFIYGTAVHWYSSTIHWFPESLNYTHNLAPDKHILHTEGCVDSEVPHWQDDKWYWSKEATDWGWDWASEENKANHPKYVPVYRYARDIIGCLNSSVEGWIDWNMVLDTNGGPNLANNWCIAPVIVDVAKDEVYYTPLYYTLSHFSKFVRPRANRIDFNNNDEELMITAAQNEDGSLVVIVLNTTMKEKNFRIQLEDRMTQITIDKEALQTIIIRP